MLQEWLQIPHERKKTLKFFDLNTIQSTILSLLLFRFLVSSDSTSLVKSNALQYIKQCCCDCCTPVSWDLWIGDHVCLRSGNDCIRDGRLSRVSLSSTIHYFTRLHHSNFTSYLALHIYCPTERRGIGSTILCKYCNKITVHGLLYF